MTSASWMPRIRPHNNYALPLFFLAVKTNVDYQVVASFVLQDESADPIKEALQVIKDWNRDWRPSFFMTGFCEEEIHAVEETFPGTTKLSIFQMCYVTMCSTLKGNRYITLMLTLLFFFCLSHIITNLKQRKFYNNQV